MWQVLVLLALVQTLSAQEPAVEAAAAETSAGPGADEARVLWEHVLEATRGSAAPDPISAFQLRAEVLRREGVQTNEVRVDYRYLAPECVRFVLPEDKEIGRFGARQRDYWLKDGEETVVLDGREHAQDRRQVDQVFALARNFIALSDPARLRVTRVESLAEPPADLPPELVRASKKLAWIRVASPDFALIRAEAPGDAETTYLVDLALQRTGLPRFAVIREEVPAGAPAAKPMLILLDDYRDQNGFRIPFKLVVYGLDPETRPPTFAHRPAQEIYVMEADLRAPLKVDDFKP